MRMRVEEGVFATVVGRRSVLSETWCRDSGQQSWGGSMGRGRDPLAKSVVVFVFGMVSSVSHTTSWEAVDLQIRKIERKLESSEKTREARVVHSALEPPLEELSW